MRTTFRIALLVGALALLGFGCNPAATPAQPEPVQGNAIKAVTCETIEETRQAIHGEYGDQMEIISDAYWEARRGFQAELRQCLDGLWKGGPCDAQWNALQGAYANAMGDVSNDDAYNEYKAKKADWDACYGNWDAAYEDWADEQRQGEERCQGEFQQKVNVAQQARTAEEATAAAKRDADLAALAEFERQCRASAAGGGTGVVGTGTVVVVDDGQGGGDPSGGGVIPTPGPILAGADACTGGSSGSSTGGAAGSGPRTGRVAENPARDVIMEVAVQLAEGVTGTPIPTNAINDRIFAGIVCTKLYSRVLEIQQAESDAIWSGNRREEIRLRREIRRYQQAQRIWCAIAEGRPPHDIALQAANVQEVRSCETDADCGPAICCSETEIGRYFCNEDGECSSEKESCDSGQVCSGRPANCVDVPERISVIPYGGTYIPVDQLRTFRGDECDEAWHWHSKSGSATAVNGQVFIDASDCGYGKMSEVQQVKIVVAP